MWLSILICCVCVAGLPFEPAGAASSQKAVTSSANSVSNNYLQGVTCNNPTHCVAVGHTESEDRTFQTLIETWDGNTWSVSPSPNQGIFPLLSGVSCSSPTSCMAVGAYTLTNATNGQTLIESWDGSTWSIVPSPNPVGSDANGGHAGLDEVSCISPSSCVAVGNYSDNGSDSQTLVESWDGSAWSVIPSPSATGWNELDSVSCTTSTSCVAVGMSSVNRLVTEQSLVESWDGSTWSIVPSPNPGSSAWLRSVSCFSQSDCEAVGLVQLTGYQTLVEHWNGNTWSVTSSPNQGIFDFLNGVSCISPTSCMAVGVSSTNGSTLRATLAESWDGNAWSVVPSADPGKWSKSVQNFAGASCTSPSDCMAVGYYTHRVTNQTLVESWDGTAFSVSPSPNPGSLNISTSSLPGGTVGQPYLATLAASGGNPPDNWKRASGKLPQGLKLNRSTGVISGTPAKKSATSTFVVEVLDSKTTTTPQAQESGLAKFTITIAPAS